MIDDDWEVTGLCADSEDDGLTFSGLGSHLGSGAHYSCDGEVCGPRLQYARVLHHTHPVGVWAVLRWVCVCVWAG